MMKLLRNTILLFNLIIGCSLLAGCTARIDELDMQAQDEQEIVDAGAQSQNEQEDDDASAQSQSEQETDNSGVQLQSEQMVENPEAQVQQMEASDTEPVGRMLTPEEFMQQYGIPQDTEYEVHDVYDGEGFLLSRSVHGAYTTPDGIYTEDMKWYSYTYEYSDTSVVSKCYEIFSEAIPSQLGYYLFKGYDQVIYEYDEPDRNQTDILKIDEAWLQLAHENIRLAEDEEFEKLEWVEGNADCLRVWIKYKDEPVGDKLWHKSDYFLFVTEDGEVYDKLYVDYDITYAKNSDEVEPTVYGNRSVYSEPNFAAHFEDVNADGAPDLLIHIGASTHWYYRVYCAYVYQNGEYVYAPGFTQLCDYRVDENGRLWSILQPGLDLHYERLFEYQNGDFVEVAEYCYKWDERNRRYVQVKWSEETESIVIVEDSDMRSIYD